MANDTPDSLLLKGLEKSIDLSDLESCESFECKAVDDSDSGEPIRRIKYVNTPYPVVQKMAESNKVESEQLYSASANEIDELKFFASTLKIRIPAWRQICSHNYLIPSYCTHKILMEDDYKPVIQPQRRLNPKVQDVVKNEIVKLLDSGLIYPISDSSWVSPTHVVPKKGGMAVVLNDNNELIPSRTVTGWRVCIDYRKLNDASRKDHFPLPLIDQISREENIQLSLWDLCLPTNAIWIMQRTSYFSKMHDSNFPRHGGRLYNVPFELMGDASDFAVEAVLGQRIDGKFKPIYYANKTLNNAQEHYTTTKKELLAVDAKPRLIRWVLLFQGVDIEIKDKKGAKNLAADHLSRLKNPDLGRFMEQEIADKFPDEHLMILKTKLNEDEPWYADYVNYIVRKTVPPNCTPEKRRRFFSQVKNYFWDEPYAFKLCPDNVMRRCVAGDEILEILAHYHSGPTGGHHSASITGRKVYESGFFWPSIFKDAKDYVMRCDALTAYKTPTRCTPFRLVYGKSCHLPVEIEHKAYWALKQCNMDLTAAAKNHFVELNELTKLRDGAYKNTQIYKERTKRWHDSRLHGDKNFKVGDKVLLFNSRFKMHPGKLKSRWYGPNVVKTVYLYSTIEIIDRNRINFKVSGQRLKKYYDGHTDAEYKEVVEFEEDTT
ncbi:reverse transcriptase domain-containing protein [Tanacetum coccineum]